MQIPKELVDQWWAKWHSEGRIQPVLEYIAQCAAEWAAQQNSSSLLEFSADEYARGVREGAESALNQPMSNETVCARCGGLVSDPVFVQEPVSMEPVAMMHPNKSKAISMEDFCDQPDWVQANWKSGSELYTATQLAAARQQGAEEERQENWKFKCEAISTAQEHLQRIAELEALLRQTLEAVGQFQRGEPCEEAFDNLTTAIAEVKP